MIEADTPVATKPEPIKIDAIIDRYIQMRDRKAELKAKFDASVATLDQAMDRCEAVILKHLDASGIDSVGSAMGTAFKSKRTSATVADWDAALGFIRDNELWNMLDRRVNKTAVIEYKEANDDLPPGLNWREETVINIRRKS